MKKSILFYFVALIAAAALLFALTFCLKGTAEANAQQAQLDMMRTLLPGGVNFTEEAYTGEDTNIRAVYKAETGYVIETVTYGYADEITMLIGVSNNGAVTGLVVKEMHETFGLGGSALSDTDFLSQFLGTKGGVAIETGSSDAFSAATGADSTSSATGAETTTAETEVYVDGISGATVTSKAIARSVNSAVGYVTGADAETSATSWGG